MESVTFLMINLMFLTDRIFRSDPIPVYFQMQIVKPEPFG
jgi:hypothetical protein